MVEVEFVFNGYMTIIQCNIDDTFLSICNQFASKIQEHLNNLYFIYNGDRINEAKLNSTFNQIANEIDLRRKKMSLIAMKLSTKVVKNPIKISKHIICPECLENARMKIEDYKIKIYECDNGHERNNILLKEYESLQKIDESKINCDLCGTKKANSYNNEFYRCNSCKINLCPLCKSTHTKEHNCVNFDEKNYKCEKHKNENYNSYCKICKKNLCMLCESEHLKHKKISFGEILPKKENKIKESKDLRQLIDSYKTNIKEFKDKIDNILNTINEGFEFYYKICNNIIDNYDNTQRNYQILQNINEINYEFIKKDISEIIKENNFSKKLNIILQTYDKINKITVSNDKNLIPNNRCMNFNHTKKIIKNIYNNKKSNNTKKIDNPKTSKRAEIEKFYKTYQNTNKKNDNGNEIKISKNNIINKIQKKNEKKIINNKKQNNAININNNKNIKKKEIKIPEANEITIIYKINENQKEIKLFGAEFLLSNRGKCYIMIKDEKYDLDLILEKFNLDNLGINTNTFEIKLKEIKNLTNISFMFNDCSSLFSLPDISGWNTSNINDISYMFYGCTSLTTFPGISHWNTKNVKNMEYLFSNCSSLKALPDISKWNTSNVINMKGLFNQCASLTSLPDISKWDMTNVSDIRRMFNGCSSITILPNISKWNTNKLKNWEDIFSGCNSLISLPDISKWAK